MEGLSRRTWLGVAAGLAVWGNRTNRGWAETRLASRIEEAPEKHPLTPALRHAADALEALDGIEDYSCTLTRNELIGHKMLAGKLDLKFREKPRSVYIKFVNPHAGRQVLFNDGKNSNNLQVKDVGLAALVGTINLAPNGKMAMEESRHPVTVIGLRALIETVIEQWLAETKIDGATVNCYPDAKVGDVPAKVIEISYARETAQAKYALTRLFIDSKTGFAVKVQNYDFPKKKADKPMLVEDYHYTDIRTKLGLKDIDFDTKNSKYGF